MAWSWTVYGSGDGGMSRNALNVGEGLSGGNLVLQVREVIRD